MACRIQNLSGHRLALDLRGGEVIYLNPGEMSRPLREELLYGHIHLPRWLAQGLVRQVDAKMSEVLEHEKTAAIKPSPPEAAPAPAAAAEADGKEEPTEERPAASGEADKPRTRGRTKDGGSKPDK